MLRLRHAGRLMRDLGAYAAANRAWWMVALILVVAIAAFLSSATQAAVPYAVYTLF